MLVVETISKIRRAHLVHGKSIKAICRELGFSRKVVRKVLRSEATEFRYEREDQPLPRIGPWQGELDELLASNASRPSRERLTLIRIFEALRGRGYEGGGCVSRSSSSTPVAPASALCVNAARSSPVNWSETRL